MSLDQPDADGQREGVGDGPGEGRYRRRALSSRGTRVNNAKNQGAELIEPIENPA
jgi:hypothetical protein